jgi:hypothetical protein
MCELSTDRGVRLRKRLGTLKSHLDEHILAMMRSAAVNLRGVLRQLPESVDHDGLEKALAEVQAAGTAERAADSLTRGQNIAVRMVGDRYERLLEQDARRLSLPVDGSSWDELRARVRDELLDGWMAAPFAECVRQLSRAERALLTGIAGAVISDLAKWVTPPSGTTQTGNGPDASRGELIEELRIVMRETPADRVEEARRAYVSAVGKWKDVEKKARYVGRWLGPPQRHALPDVPAVTIEPFRRTAVGSLPAEARPARPGEIRASERWIWRVSVVVAALVTPLVGLVALYTGDPTWGTADDMIASFLWGLGLTAVGSAAVSTAAYAAATR